MSIREGERREREHVKKYHGMKTCPRCKKPKYDKYGWIAKTRCKDEFHVWFCGNNYTSSGCYGHAPGSTRCMDCG